MGTDYIFIILYFLACAVRDEAFSRSRSLSMDVSDKDHVEYEEEGDLSASGHYRWARFNGPTFTFESNIAFEYVPRLKLAPIAQPDSGSASQRLLSHHEYHLSLTGRNVISGYEMGINIQNMGDFSRICTGSNCQIFGSMYRNRRVVVKAILPDLINDKLTMEEFNFEVEILARMAHPNICEVLGSGAAVGAVDKCVPFIVMEELQPLQTCFNMQGSLHAATSFEQVLSLARGLACALRYLHEELFEDAMIIHRDVKPENMGIDSEGNLKLIDFGLGRCVRKRTTCDDTYIMTGETGTLRYMAPGWCWGHRHLDEMSAHHTPSLPFASLPHHPPSRFVQSPSLSLIHPPATTSFSPPLTLIITHPIIPHPTPPHPTSLRGRHVTTVHREGRRVQLRHRRVHTGIEQSVSGQMQEIGRVPRSGVH